MSFNFEIPNSEHIKTTIEEVSPDRARQLLSTNQENRRLDTQTVDRYAAAMKRGEWKFHHQGVAVDEAGNLLDGQHRLNAIVKAGVSVPLLVVAGVTRDVFSVLDTGKRRSAADTLRLHGLPDTNHLAAALRYLHIYRTTPNSPWHGASTRLTNEQIVKLYEENPRMLDHVREARPIAMQTGIVNSAAAAAIYITREANPEADWDSWREGITTGANLDVKDARLAFRNFFANSRVKNSKRRIEAKEHIAIYIRAWNYWVLGEKRQHLQYRTGDPMPKPVRSRPAMWQDQH